MKAIRVETPGAPEVMKLKEVPDLKPSEGQMVVNIRAAGVNPVDTYIRAGGQGYAPRCPYTPGMDGAGTVLATGGSVAGYSVGDRVYCAGSLTGTYAEQAVCRQEQVFPLPDNLTFSQGAAIGVPYGTAYRALFHRARAVKGETVLIHGASGGVGIAAVQLACAAGLTVFGTAGTEDGRKLVLQQGAAHAVDHHQADHFEELLELNGGEGFDVILEMLANVNLGKDLPLLAFGGRVVVIGSRGNVEITPRHLMGRDAAVLGMSLLNASDEDLAGIHGALAAGFADGSLKPVIGTELPLARAAESHHRVIESSALGKIVLIPAES